MSKRIFDFLSLAYALSTFATVIIAIAAFIFGIRILNDSTYFVVELKFFFHLSANNFKSISDEWMQFERALFDFHLTYFSTRQLKVIHYLSLILNFFSFLLSFFPSLSRTRVVKWRMRHLPRLHLPHHDLCVCM